VYPCPGAQREPSSADRSVQPAFFVFLCIFEKLLSCWAFAKYDKLVQDENDMEFEMQESEIDVTSKATVRSRHRQMILIYVVFLAEA
jgi:hypothetical protein